MPTIGNAYYPNTEVPYSEPSEYLAGLKSNAELMDSTLRGFAKPNGLQVVGDYLNPQRNDLYYASDSLGGYKLHKYFTTGSVVVNNQVNPSVPSSDSIKLCYSENSNTARVITGNSRYGYTMFRFINNKTLTTDSLAQTTSDITSWRINEIRHCVDCVTAYQAHSAENGTWQNQNLATTDIPVHNSGISLNMEFSFSTTVGAWREYTIDVPSNGEFSVSFRRSSGSTTSATVYVDGVAVDSGFPLNGGSNDVTTKNYKTDVGTKVIRVENTGAGGTLSIIGINYTHLIDSKRGENIDTVGYYADDTNYGDYIKDTNSANNYAIFDADANLWGGSFHGGEENITTEMIADGEILDMSSFQPTLCKRLEVLQEAEINWGAFGGGSVTTKTSHTICDTGYALKCQHDGNANVNYLYTSLYGVQNDFTEILSPEAIDLSTIPIDSDAFPLKNGYIEYRNSKSQKLSIEHTVFEDEMSSVPMPRIRNSSSYNKFYYGGLAGGGTGTLTSIFSVNVFNFG